MHQTSDQQTLDAVIDEIHKLSPPMREQVHYLAEEIRALIQGEDGEMTQQGALALALVGAESAI